MIEKKQPEEIFHVIDTWWWPAWEPHNENHSCWINKNWKLYCWGDNSEWQRNVPSWIFDSWTKWVWLWFQYSMAIDKNWKLYCWWKDHDWTCTNIPSIFTNSSANTKNIALWAYNACALDNSNNNKLYCWGWYEKQKCISEYTPNWWEDWIKFMDVWDYTVCVIKENWNLKCWWEDDWNCNKHSDNLDFWQYEINNDNNWNTDMKKVAVWKTFVCWLKNNWDVKCFTNRTEWWYSYTSFTNIPNWFEHNVIDIQAGPRIICALNKNWEVWCWWWLGDIYGLHSYKIKRVTGSSYPYYEDDPNADNSNTAKTHRKNNNKSFWMWFYHICVIKKDNTTECWGVNSPNNSNPNNNFIPSSFEPNNSITWLCNEELFK
jgi:hypothetical protein